LSRTCDIIRVNYNSLTNQPYSLFPAVSPHWDRKRFNHNDNSHITIILFPGPASFLTGFTWFASSPTASQALFPARIFYCKCISWHTATKTLLLNLPAPSIRSMTCITSAIRPSASYPLATGVIHTTTTAWGTTRT